MTYFHDDVSLNDENIESKAERTRAYPDDQTENQKAEATKVDLLHDLVVAFGLEEEFEQGKYTCPITGERLTRENLGRMQYDGENITLFSFNARIGKLAPEGRPVTTSLFHYP